MTDEKELIHSAAIQLQMTRKNRTSQFFSAMGLMSQFHCSVNVPWWFRCLTPRDNLGQISRECRLMTRKTQDNDLMPDQHLPGIGSLSCVFLEWFWCTILYTPHWARSTRVALAQCLSNVEDVGLALYKCCTGVLYLLGLQQQYMRSRYH